MVITFRIIIKIYEKKNFKIEKKKISKIFFFYLFFFYIIRNVITNQKKLKFFFFEKTQNNDMFISPKRKKTIPEMALKSFIISKLDHQMSKS